MVKDHSQSKIVPGGGRSGGEHSGAVIPSERTNTVILNERTNTVILNERSE